ncbi:hypothetical protein TREES_T100013851 [Tupaia chinensis]|uniref:Uncharacterized protein n=1 Tax=Tupaia chinensis TaxID=246437 RepID=L9L3X1_TUPCH|nr:hypothetical protein TREES_T100013851 [Tupaia chinensis]
MRVLLTKAPSPLAPFPEEPPEPQDRGWIILPDACSGWLEVPAVRKFTTLSQTIRELGTHLVVTVGWTEEEVAWVPAAVTSWKGRPADRKWPCASTEVAVGTKRCLCFQRHTRQSSPVLTGSCLCRLVSELPKLLVLNPASYDCRTGLPGRPPPSSGLTGLEGGCAQSAHTGSGTRRFANVWRSQICRERQDAVNKQLRAYGRMLATLRRPVYRVMPTLGHCQRAGWTPTPDSRSSGRMLTHNLT